LPVTMGGNYSELLKGLQRGAKADTVAAWY